MSIFDPLIHELANRGARRAAIFGTRFVIASELFGALTGVEIVKPGPDEIELIHNIYVQVAASGKGLAEQHDQLTALAQTLVSRDGVDTILFAGTDLTLLFDESNTQFPHIDCAALHIEAILKRLVTASADSR